MNLQVDEARLADELEQLGRISDAPSPAVTRVVFTDTDLRGRAYLKTLCEDAGLSVRTDAVGNTFARWEGEDASLPAVATGSHVDALPFAGRFDGTVGVIGALESFRALRRAGLRPRRSIELIVFTSEEPTRYGIGCLGSRFLAGVLDDSAGDSLKDREGLTLNQARTAAGFGGALSSARLATGAYHAFVELHIEQGPLLEKRGVPLGVVTAIAAPAGLRLFLEGEGGHAGAVLMPDRRDAFLAAAEISLAVEKAVLATGAIDTVGTVGICDIFPGAVNSIPSRVRLEMDIRDTDGDRRDGAIATVLSEAGKIGERRRVGVRHEMINADPPASCAPFVVEAFEKACRTAGFPYDRMISRAYHDSLFMARTAPTGMLFIPCRDGMSHRPEEYASPEDMARGALVLAHALADLAQ